MCLSVVAVMLFLSFLHETLKSLILILIPSVNFYFDVILFCCKCVGKKFEVGRCAVYNRSLKIWLIMSANSSHHSGWNACKWQLVVKIGHLQLDLNFRNVYDSNSVGNNFVFECSGHYVRWKTKSDDVYEIICFVSVTCLKFYFISTSFIVKWTLVLWLVSVFLMFQTCWRCICHNLQFFRLIKINFLLMVFLDLDLYFSSVSFYMLYL